MTRKTITTATIAALILPLALSAQGGGGARNPNRPLGGRRNMQGPPPGDSMQRNRAALQGELGQRLWVRMQNVLGLSNDQMTKVRDINQQFAERHRVLGEQEREVRMSINDERIAGDTTRSKQMSDLLDRMIKTQRQRIDLMEAEQQALGKVLTPHQRAAYMGMQEQMRRQVEMLRQGGRMGGPDGQPQGPPPDGFAGPGGGRRGNLRRPPDGPPDGPPLT